jgi:hypothetical protein
MSRLQSSVSWLVICLSMAIATYAWSCEYKCKEKVSKYIPGARVTAFSTSWTTATSRSRTALLCGVMVAGAPFKRWCLG